MHKRPYPIWYTSPADAALAVPLLDDTGHPAQGLATEAERVLAALAAAVHASAYLLGERELRQLESFIAIQRWRR